MASSTAVELDTTTASDVANAKGAVPKSLDDDVDLVLENGGPSNNEAQDGQTVAAALETWRNPRRNTWRLAAVFFAFINLGMNEASYGPLLPYIQQDYHLSYTVASLIFISPFLGYILAALVSDRLHMQYGRRGIAIISPASKILAYIVVCVHPPYPVVVVILGFAGFGNGLLDSAWNAWVGSMAQSNQILGLLHGCYGIGAVIAPSIATAMIAKYGCDWWQFFFVTMGLVVMELLATTTAFWSDDKMAYRSASRTDNEDAKGMTLQALKDRTTWIAAVFVLLYQGLEVAIGGYIVVFMTEVRHGHPFPSGLTATGFWLGITIGRMGLGFVTPRIGERMAVIGYIICAVGVELLFWLVPQFIVSAVAIALVGFFLGPVFPSVIVLVTKILPRNMHVASIGFSTALGGSGAAIVPFMVGAIASTRGVATLQPIILSFLAVLLGVWLSFPRLPKNQRQE